jgi:DNA-binding GntR family transcriptional regulator
VFNGAADVTLRFKQKDLCTLLGTQRTTLVSTLDRLVDDEILEYDSNQISILDMKRLSEFLQ